MIRRALTVFCALILTATAFAGGDPVAKKLDAAKTAYQTELEEARKAVKEWFEKRDDAARKDGNRKLVDQIKAEKQAFDDKGELPKSVPAALTENFASARSTLIAAYNAAVKGYLQAKKDDDAEAAEKQLEKFKKVSAVAGAGQPALDTKADAGGASDADTFKSKLAGKVTYDPKTSILTVTYNFTDKKELQDFECGDSKPVVSGNLKLDAGQTIRYPVKFDAVKVTGALGIRVLRGNFITATNGVQAGVGGNGNDTMYLSPLGDNDILSQVLPRNLRGGTIRFALAIEEKRTAFHFGTQTLGRDAAPPGPIQIGLHGGQAGFTFSSLVFTGKVNAEWAKSFLEGK